MKNIYLLFYEQQTRKLDIDMFKGVDLEQYQHLYIEDDHVLLKPYVLIGKLDRKPHFGFLRQETKDVYIEKDELKDAMHDDIILVDIRKQAKIIEIVERSLKTVVATVKKRKNGFKFFTDVFLNKKLEVEPYDRLVNGYVVSLDVLHINKDKIFAKVNHIIGHINDPDIETLKIVSGYEWPQSFSDEVLDSIKDIRIDMEKERLEREDFRDQLIITIDGSDAKDLDDAISLSYENGMYELSVHIADVSHFVREKTLLNQIAYERATSVYLADRVIPMLPHILSNDWCSLNPYEEKLTLSCVMKLNDEGHVIDFRIVKSIITSKRRLTYQAVNQFLNEDVSLNNQNIESMLIHMNELSQKLQLLRRKRGEIEFDSTELGFKVNKDGQVIDIYQRETDVAEALIESFMLIANETVAKHMHDVSLPSIYRIHEKPDVLKLKMALETISKLGIPVQLKHIGDPALLQKITDKTADTPLGNIVHMLLLRSMQKAKYAYHSDIHFGLGARYYTHFTSPIRRYPDLILHRMIHRFVLNETKNYEKDYQYYESVMEEIAKHTSTQERKAIQLERDVAKLKSCEYMSNKIDEVFKATITQMMPSGMFVSLDNGIEGFVPLRLLDDFYQYDENYLMYVGRRGHRYKLGDQVKVKLVSVDMLERKMDFDMVKTKTQKSKSSYNKKKSKKRKRR